MSKTKPNRGLRIALLVSLALNLLFIGLIAGAAMRGPDARPSRAMDLSLGPLTRALAPQDRKAIGRAVRDEIQHGDQHRPTTRKARDAELQALLTALRADPFVAEDVARLLSAMRSRAEGWATSVQFALVAHLSNMTADQRAAFTNRLVEEFQKGDKHGKNKGKARRD